MTKKLLSMKNDYVFKRVFADPHNVDALADFLKAVLTLPKEEYGKIEIVDPHIQRRFEDDKLGILDVKLHTATGKIIQVEIQVENEECFRERIVDYLARLFVDQMVRGGDYGDLRRVISIVITDFKLITENDNYRNRYLLADCDTGSVFSDIIEIDTLELVKLPKGNEHSALLDWLRLINAKEEKEMAELAERNPAIGKVTAVIKQMSEDEVERALAEEREKARRIRDGQLAYARNEGLKTGEERGENRGIKIGEERGIKIGEKRGSEKGKLEVARNLKRQGVDVDIIAAATGLSVDEIEKL